MADFVAGESLSNGTHSASNSVHSRESSMSSERSAQDKENTNTQTNTLTRRDSDASSASSQQLILRDGGKLAEESRTEVPSSVCYDNSGFNGMKNGAGDSSSGAPEIPARQPSAGGGTGTARHKVTKTGSSLASTIPEEEITIPNDGNLVTFSADAMATFLRYMRVEDRLVNHLHRNGMDGRKFGRLKDSDLDNLQLKNPVVIFFRDKTAPAANKKPKQRLPFVL